MNTIGKLLIAFALSVPLSMVAAPAFAQGNTHTVTITEEQINDSYRVTNPARRSVAEVSVDLQEGQAVHTATFTWRNYGPVEVVTTATPSIRNGRVYWTVTSVTADGETVSDELLRQINSSIETSWRNYVRRQLPAGRITDIQISETQITVTFTHR